MDSPALPFEFTVAGRPVSHQSNNRRLLGEWQRRVREAAAASWLDSAPLTIALRLVLTYYHSGSVARIDGDNLLKAVQDALIGLIYDDDKRVTDTATRMTSIDGFVKARWASRLLLNAFADGDPFIHVIIESAPSHEVPLR